MSFHLGKPILVMMIIALIAIMQAGGRVLAVTALGSTLEMARARAYEAVSRIHFENCHYRRDIALNAVTANMTELL